MPWVTIGIMGLCVIIYIFSIGPISKFDDQKNSISSEIHEYYISHPYLELDQAIKKEFFITEELGEVIESLAGDKYSEGHDEAQREEEQAYLDDLVEKLNQTTKSHPFFKFGFVPNNKTFTGLIGHMFLHVGWLHLLGNLLYLYVMGPFIEDTWGKPVYGVFYMITGILAAMAFAMHYPNSGVPMIGASGAISAVMGGFLIRHWHARIRYFYLFGFRIRGTFTAPAWAMLPVGFVMELVNANIMDSIAPGGGGVAHWAHVWGFIFGIAGAFAIKFLKIEKKFVAPIVEAQSTFVNKGFVAYEEAMQELSVGNKDIAFAILMDAAREDPSNQDVIESLWNTALDLGRMGEVKPFLTRLIEREVQQARLEEALSHYRLLRAQVPDARFSTHTKIKIFEQSINARDHAEANSLFKELINEVNLASPPGLVMEFCLAALKFDLDFDQSIAGKVVELARQHPEIPAERKESLKQQLYTIPKQKKDAPIKVDSPYDYSIAEADSKVDMGSVIGAGSVSGASSLIVPPVSTNPIIPSAPQEPAAAAANLQGQPPPIFEEPTIPIDLQEPGIPPITLEPAIPITPSQSQPPPIFAGSAAAIDLQEPELPPIIQEPPIPITPFQSQPPPLPIEPVIPADFQEPEIPLMKEEPTIAPSPQESTTASPPPLAQPPPPPPPIEPILPTMTNEAPIPILEEEVVPSAPPEPAGEEIFVPPPPPAPRRSIRVTEGVPLGVKGGKIALNIENMGQRAFALGKIKVIAVVKITHPGERPFLLIDLFVDDPGAPNASIPQEAFIRTLRLLSTNFNPQKFVAGGQGPLEAFKIFTSSLLRLSKAKPFPDLESVQLKKVASFPSIKEYEDSFLGAGGM